jgi:hypothetical protein
MDDCAPWHLMPTSTGGSYSRFFLLNATTRQCCWSEPEDIVIGVFRPTGCLRQGHFALTVSVLCVDKEPQITDRSWREGNTKRHHRATVWKPGQRWLCECCLAL